MPAETASQNRRYTAFVYLEEPETRWFHRHVLRRRRRRTVIHAGLLDTFTVECRVNGIANAVFVMADPMEALSRA